MKVIFDQKFYSAADLAHLFSIRINDAVDLINSGDIMSSQAFGRVRLVPEYAIKKFLNIHAIHPILSHKLYQHDDQLEMLRSRLNEMGDYIVGSDRFNISKKWGDNKK